MKGLIKVIVVFCVLQSVCCDTNSAKSLITSNDIAKAFAKVFQNCDAINTTQLLHSKTTISSDPKTVTENINECDDKEAKQKLLDSYEEVSSFFKNCIDPQYIQTLEKLDSAVLRMFNLQCFKSEKLLTIDDIFDIISDKSELSCYTENALQVASCIFSEEEMTRLSKNVSQVVDFTAMLIGGNDNECGVVNRIEKCVQKTMINCKTYHNVIGSTVQIMLKSFDCKIDETTEMSHETSAEPLRLNDFIPFHEKIIDVLKQCNVQEYQVKLKHSLSTLVLPTTGDTSDKTMQKIISVCEVPGQKMMFFQTIDEIVEDLKKCIDTKYVKYVDNIIKSVKRGINISCGSREQHIKLILDLLHNPENSVCVVNKAFPILGCVFSSEGVREIIADSSKLSNFTMNLLGGGDNACGTIYEVQKCIIESLDSCTPSSNLLKYELKLVMNSFECKIDEFQNTSTTNDMEEVSTTTSQSLITTQNNLIKKFAFMNFNEAFGFMTQVALYASEIKLYPTLTNEDNKVMITMKSEDSDKGQQMAAFLDKVSKSKQ